MPPRVDVAFFLSVDHDPVDDTIAAIGLSIVRHAAMEEHDHEIVVIENGKRRFRGRWHCCGAGTSHR